MDIVGKRECEKKGGREGERKKDGYTDRVRKRGRERDTEIKRKRKREREKEKERNTERE